MATNNVDIMPSTGRIQIKIKKKISDFWVQH